MKLSRREAVLISILLIVTVLFLEYRLVYVPQKAKYDLLAAQDVKVQSEVDRINRLISSIPKLTSDKNRVFSEISNAAQPFFDELNPDALLWTNYNELVKNGLNIESITNSELDVNKIKIPNVDIKTLSYGLKTLTEEYANVAASVDAPAKQPSPTPKPTNNNQKEDERKEGIEVYKAQIVATGTYDQIRQFISTIESMKKTISVTTLDMTSSGSQDLIDAIIMISYYGTKKIVPTSDNINEWSQPPYEGGTGNPFVAEDTMVTPTPTVTP